MMVREKILEAGLYGAIEWWDLAVGAVRRRREPGVTDQGCGQLVINEWPLSCSQSGAEGKNERDRLGEHCEIVGMTA